MSSWESGSALKGICCPPQGWSLSLVRIALASGLAESMYLPHCVFRVGLSTSARAAASSSPKLPSRAPAPWQPLPSTPPQLYTSTRSTTSPHAALTAPDPAVPEPAAPTLPPEDPPEPEEPPP